MERALLREPGAYTVHFPTDSVGYAIGMTEIYKTNDAGTTWNTSAVFNNQIELGAIHFTSKDTGIAVLKNASVGFLRYYTTTNGGGSWQGIASDTAMGWDIEFPSKNIGYSFRGGSIKL